SQDFLSQGEKQQFVVQVTNTLTLPVDHTLSQSGRGFGNSHRCVTYGTERKALDTIELINQHDPVVALSGNDDQTRWGVMVARLADLVGGFQTQQLAERDAEPDDAPDVHQPQQYSSTAVWQRVYGTHLGHFLTDIGRQSQPCATEPKDQHRE